jgi:hypothetical protein
VNGIQSGDRRLLENVDTGCPLDEEIKMEKYLP